jgi:hypothetical protein
MLTTSFHLLGNGSDVFGSDICTCKPYLTYAIEECVKTAQKGGVGVVAYFRKEGRALGEVTKYVCLIFVFSLCTLSFRCSISIHGVSLHPQPPLVPRRWFPDAILLSCAASFDLLRSKAPLGLGKHIVSAFVYSRPMGSTFVSLFRFSWHAVPL